MLTLPGDPNDFDALGEELLPPPPPRETLNLGLGLSLGGFFGKAGPSSSLFEANKFCHQLNFLGVFHVSKYYFFAWKANNWPPLGIMLFLFILLMFKHNLSQTLEGTFVLARRPSRALHFTSCIASRTWEIQGHWQVCRVRHRGPWTLSKKKQWR